MNKEEFVIISDLQFSLFQDVVEFFDNVKRNKLSEKEAECVFNLYRRLRLFEQKVFDAILGSDHKAFDKKAVKKFISLSVHHISELRLIGDKFLIGEISENQFNSMLMLYEQLNGLFARKILKAIKSGYSDDQIQELYNEIYKLPAKINLIF
jgi:hypothetical protein